MMKMRKLLAVLAISALAITSLVACGGDDSTDDVQTEETATEEDASADASEEEVASYIEVPVTIYNVTGVEIYELYMSGESSDEWGDDLLGDSTFPDQTYIDLVFYVDTANLLWDMIIYDSEGTSIEFYGIDISDMPADGFAIDLTFDGTTATATAYDPNAVDSTDDSAMTTSDISSVLAGSIWIDDELTTYGFETDGVTLYVALPDGSEYIGEYAFVADESGVIVLGMAIADLDAEVYFIVTEIGDDYILLADYETGAESVLAYVTEVE